jgi:hypothetical protein
VTAFGAPSLLRKRRYYAPREDVTSSSSEHFVSADAVTVTTRKQSAPQFSIGSCPVQSDLADDRLGAEHIHAIDARQIHSGDAL